MHSIKAEIINVRNSKEFIEKSKGHKYAANMTGNKKTVHIICNDDCYDSDKLYSFIPFDDLNEVLSFTPRLHLCEKCFPNQEELRVDNEFHN